MPDFWTRETCSQNVASSSLGTKIGCFALINAPACENPAAAGSAFCFDIIIPIMKGTAYTNGVN
jgi:hypothetical protein